VPETDRVADLVRHDGEVSALGDEEPHALGALLLHRERVVGVEVAELRLHHFGEAGERERRRRLVVVEDARAAASERLLAQVVHVALEARVSAPERRSDVHRRLGEREAVDSVELLHHRAHELRFELGPAGLLATGGVDRGVRRRSVDGGAHVLQLAIHAADLLDHLGRCAMLAHFDEAAREFGELMVERLAVQHRERAVAFGGRAGGGRPVADEGAVRDVVGAELTLEIAELVDDALAEHVVDVRPDVDAGRDGLAGDRVDRVDHDAPRRRRLRRLHHVDLVVAEIAATDVARFAAALEELGVGGVVVVRGFALGGGDALG
jgi:hypothetical protein